MWRNGRYTRRKVLSGGLAGAAALGLAACGGSSNNTSKSNGAAPVGTRAASAATGVPAAGRSPSAGSPAGSPAAGAKPAKRGGTHVAVWETEASGQLDPHLMKAGFVAPITEAIFNGFMRENFSDLSKLVPELAASWETPDPTTFVFHLRNGVKFHDGTDYNADIAKWNAERILQPGFVMEGKYTGAAAGISNIEVVDQNTIKFTFSSPRVDAIESFYFDGGQGLTGAVSRKAAEAAGKDFWKHPVGTGPYMFKQWDTGSKIVVARNDNYFETIGGQKLPYADELHQIALPDPAVRIVNIKSGAVSSTIVQPDDVKDLEGKGVYIVQGGPEWLQFYPNHQQGIFKDVHIRRALAYAIDRDALVKTVFLGQAQPNNGIPKRSKWYDANFKGYTFDPKKAKEEMAAAGMPNGFSFECMVLPTGVRPKAVEFMQAQLASLGIKIDIKPTESNAYVDRLMVRGEGDCFFALTGTLGLNATGGFEATAIPNPGRKENPNDPKMADMLAKIRSTFDENDRRKLIADAQQYYFYDLVALIPVVDDFRSHAVRNEWQGFDMVPPDTFYPDFREVHLTA
jgi:ABC-type transport system substrate-binding protein